MFSTPQFVDLARSAGVAIVYAHNPKYPQLADLSGDFVYAWLQNAEADEPTGYTPAAISAGPAAQGLGERGMAAPDLPRPRRARFGR